MTVIKKRHESKSSSHQKTEADYYSITRNKGQQLVPRSLGVKRPSNCAQLPDRVEPQLDILILELIYENLDRIVFVGAKFYVQKNQRC